MKSLSSFIFEAQFFDLFKTPEQRRRYTAAEFYTNNSKASWFKPFKITNKGECDKFWRRFTNWASRLGGGSFENRVKELGFVNLDELVSFVLDSIEKKEPFVEKVAGFKELGEFFKECYNVKRSAFKKAHEEFVNTYGAAGREIDEEYTGDDLTPEEFEHAAVCRSKWGETAIMLYVFGKKWTEDHNLIKQNYVYDTGCNYYHARPILLKNWLKPEKASSRRATGMLDTSED